MASVTGLTIVKEFDYRGNPAEQWSNKYYLTGPPPATNQEWETLFFQMAALEQPLFLSTCKIVGGYGYNDNADNAHAVFGIDLHVPDRTISGTLAPIPGHEMAGDQAAMVEWKTYRKNTRGKWIYLRKYFHAGNDDQTDSDNISAAYHAALTTFAQALFDGNWPGARRIRSAKQDEDLAAPIVSWYCTTRSLKRRGKRP